MSPIVWLHEPGCTDAKIVGGKAAGLGRLAAQHPVPAGFCLTAAAHDGGPVLDAATAAAVSAAYAELGRLLGAADPPVAVRSSAVDEDGAGASFAGVYTSYLNVRGAPSVLAAIERCGAAGREARVARYRDERGLASAGLGVLVQELVIADQSAVVFSVHPTTGARENIVINANYGFGESVVGGLASPDSWIVRKPDLLPLCFTLGAKERMTVLCADGTREVAVPRTLRERACLDDAKVRELAALALRLESSLGWAVDIECAYRDARLFLLQCRPVTSGLAPRP